MTEIVFQDESYRIMGACFEVYKEMGCGLLEPVYQECLEMELSEQGIAFQPQAELELRYKDRVLLDDVKCCHKRGHSHLRASLLTGHFFAV